MQTSSWQTEGAILHAEKMCQGWQILIPIYLRLLEPLGIVFSVLQARVLVQKESFILGSVCVLTCVHVSGGRERKHGVP